MTATVAGGEGRTVLLEGSLDRSPGDFAEGRLSFADGAAGGLRSSIVSARDTGLGTVRLQLSDTIDAAFSQGDAVMLTIGCDRRFATCRDRFANTANFRGFPHLPGSDLTLAVAKSDGVHDGSPVVP